LKTSHENLCKILEKSGRILEFWKSEPEILYDFKVLENPEMPTKLLPMIVKI
jgi:hypothetical protein